MASRAFHSFVRPAWHRLRSAPALRVGGGLFMASTALAYFDAQKRPGMVAWGRPALAQTSSSKGLAPASERRPKPRTIVFAFDESEGTQFAFAWALDNFFRPSDKILLLNVRTPPVLDRYGRQILSEYMIAKADEELHQLDRVAMQLNHEIGEKFALQAEEHGISAELHLIHGAAPRTVCDVAKEREVDTIVMGTHGRGALGRLISGSVSTYVLHHSHCPVLVVRPSLDNVSKDPQDGTSVPPLSLDMSSQNDS